MIGDILPIVYHTTGLQRQVKIDGKVYSVTHLYCACAEAGIVEQERRPDGIITVVIDCPRHGPLDSVATPCQTTETISPSAIFGWAEDQALRKVARSHTPTWGYAGGRG